MPLEPEAHDTFVQSSELHNYHSELIVVRIRSLEYDRMFLEAEI